MLKYARGWRGPRPCVMNHRRRESVYATMDAETADARSKRLACERSDRAAALALRRVTAERRRAIVHAVFVDYGAGVMLAGVFTQFACGDTVYSVWEDFDPRSGAFMNPQDVAWRVNPRVAPTVKDAAFILGVSREVHVYVQRLKYVEA